MGTARRSLENKYLHYRSRLDRLVNFPIRYGQLNPLANPNLNLLTDLDMQLESAALEYLEGTYHIFGEVHKFEPETFPPINYDWRCHIMWPKVSRYLDLRKL